MRFRLTEVKCIKIYGAQTIETPKVLKRLVMSKQVLTTLPAYQDKQGFVTLGDGHVGPVEVEVGE